MAKIKATATSSTAAAIIVIVVPILAKLKRYSDFTNSYQKISVRASHDIYKIIDWYNENSGEAICEYISSSSTLSAQEGSFDDFCAFAIACAGFWRKSSINVFIRIVVWH
jgi:hypothetical protein